MSELSGSVNIDRPHLSLWERMGVWLTWALGGALFLTVGWMAMEPTDPLGPVCVLTSKSGVFMFVQAAALVAVCAGVCTLIAGRSVVDVGMFAAALGLAAVSLRGGTTEYLLVYGNGSPDGAMPTGVLAIRFAAASVGWMAVMMIAPIVSLFVMRWCFGSRSDVTTGDRAEANPVQLVHCAGDIPSLDLSAGTIRAPQTPLADGLLHTAVATGVGLMAFNVLTTGSASRAIQHGQSCFVVAASVWLACYFAHRISPVRSAFWSILAVGLMALLGYLWSALRSGGGQLPPNIPDSSFMRVLPIQFISVGTATALSVLWSMHVAMVEHAASAGGSRTRKPGVSPREKVSA